MRAVTIFGFCCAPKRLSDGSGCSVMILRRAVPQLEVSWSVLARQTRIWPLYFLASRDRAHAYVGTLGFHPLLGKVKPHPHSSYRLTMQATGFVISPSIRIGLDSPESSILLGAYRASIAICLLPLFSSFARQPGRAYWQGCLKKRGWGIAPFHPLALAHQINWLVALSSSLGFVAVS
jgi:hypothetical protein